MAVYTEISDDALRDFLAHFDIPPLRSISGIAEGVENSNFLMETEGGRFVLTLFERRTKGSDLPYFFDLMMHLAESGLPCPRPLVPDDREAGSCLMGKPALIVTFLPGKVRMTVPAADCRQVGEILARLHDAGRNFPRVRDNAMSMIALAKSGREICESAARISPELAHIIATELDYACLHWPAGLPGGTGHTDLFPDNLLWLDGKISGVLDFYFACTTQLAYDLAVTLNAWCFDDDGAYVPEAAAAMVAGYERVRRLSEAERSAMPVLLRGAALRFLVSRTVDWVREDADAMVTPKDPREYLEILNFHKGQKGIKAYGF